MPVLAPFFCHRSTIRELFTVCALFAIALSPVESAQEDTFFEAKIRPVLVEHCHECHSAKAKDAEKLRGGLLLDNADLAKAGGESGPAIVPGKPNESLLISALRYSEFEMPPKGKLPDNVVNDFAKWIQDGAYWPKSNSNNNSTITQQQTQRKTDYEYWRKHHWSWRPIRVNAIPPVATNSWAKTRIDVYVIRQLQNSKLTPSTEASRATLIRRLYFDLLGLPPSYEKVQAFIADDQPDAYERLVDRILASPAYGERWGRHWLDVARYADNGGFNSQTPELYTDFPYAYTYRDYVIRAFNEDLPYDRFVIEQLAADRLNLGDDNRALAALGFLTLGDKSFGVSREDQIDDCIDTVTRGLMGITVSCARCHDHKYDPIPTADYYSLFGIFKNSNISVASRLHTKQKSEILPVLFRSQQDRKEYEQRIHSAEASLNDLKRRAANEVLRHLQKRFADYLLAASELADQTTAKQLDQEFLKRWKQFLAEAGKKKLAIFQFWIRSAKLKNDKHSLDELISNFTSKLAIQPDAVPADAILAQALFDSQPANHNELASTIANVILRHAFASKPQDSASQKAQPQDDVARFELSKKGPLRNIFSNEKFPWNLTVQQLSEQKPHKQHEPIKQLANKLTAIKHSVPRAVALRDRDRMRDSHVLIRGNPRKQGTKVARRFLALLQQNERPEFNDSSGRLELALAIVSNDNPLTARSIVNRLWHHHFGKGFTNDNGDFGTRSDPPSHPELLDYLAANLMRNDWSLKSIQREIVTSMTYRQSSFDRDIAVAIDPENKLYWKMNRRKLELESLRDTLLFVSGQLNRKMNGPAEKDAWKSNRRTIYGYVNRYRVNPTFETFDFPSTARTASKRNETLVPQQALFLMNSPFGERAAKELSRRVCDADVEQRIQQLFEHALSRRATTPELEAAKAFVQSNTETDWANLAHGLMMSNEFTYID